MFWIGLATGVLLGSTMGAVLMGVVAIGKIPDNYTERPPR
jgi:hypothetical protein